MKPKIYALGIGHTTPVFLDLALDCGYEIGGLYHYNDERKGKAYGFDILGSFDDLFKEDLCGRAFLLTMGDMAIRRDLTEKILSRGGALPTIIHPQAYVSRWADVGKTGVIIFQFAEVEPDARVADHCVLRAQTCLTHSSSLGEYCFMSSKSMIGAYIEVSRNVFMGMGSLAISDKVKTIGENAYVGARALLTKPVPPNAVMAGFPAKVLRFRDVKPDLK